MPKFASLAVPLTFVLAMCGGPRELSPTPAPSSAPLLPAAPQDTPATAATETSPAPTSAPSASTFPDPAQFEWVEVATGFESPVDIQFPPDGSGRMFIVEQAGRIQVVESNGVATGTFLDLAEKVNSGGNEQGLLGLAFHPAYAENGFFYVNYTDYDHHNVIARFRVSSDPNVADAASETTLVIVDDPYGNHNGGVLTFGQDGYLYAGLGDGGSAGDPHGNGQNTNTLLGKVLRLDVDGGEPYAIPGNNPYSQGGGSPEVWAYGLRNPWRMSFDMATGDLYIADVGQGEWEEVDFMGAGAAGGTNFGWSFREGAHEYGGSAPAGVTLTDPVAEYSHSEGGCSITGGYVYRGAMPDWNGIYLYGDYCSGLLWGLLRTPGAAGGTWESSLLYETGANITTFGQDPGGEVYFADRAGGIYRLQALP